MPLKRIVSIGERSVRVKKHPGSKVRRTDIVMSLALEPFLQRDPLSSTQCFLAFKPSNMCPLHECIFLYLCQYSSPGLVSGYFPFIRRYDQKCASFYLMLLAALDPMLPSPTKNKMKHCLIIRFGLIFVSIKAICFSFKT